MRTQPRPDRQTGRPALSEPNTQSTFASTPLGVPPTQASKPSGFPAAPKFAATDEAQPGNSYTQQGHRLRTALPDCYPQPLS